MDRDRNGHDGPNGQEWTAKWTMDNGQWTMDRDGMDTYSRGHFLCLSIRPSNVKSIASMMSIMSIRVPVH